MHRENFRFFIEGMELSPLQVKEHNYTIKAYQLIQYSMRN
jgi:hypothetical protein